MPIYSYKCKECGYTATKILTIEARDKQVCECGEALKRGIDRPGLVWAPSAGGYR